MEGGKTLEERRYRQFTSSTGSLWLRGKITLGSIGLCIFQKTKMIPDSNIESASYNPFTVNDNFWQF